MPSLHLRLVGHELGLPDLDGITKRDLPRVECIHVHSVHCTSFLGNVQLHALKSRRTSDFSELTQQFAVRLPDIPTTAVVECTGLSCQNIFLLAMLAGEELKLRLAWLANLSLNLPLPCPLPFLLKLPLIQLKSFNFKVLDCI